MKTCPSCQTTEHVHRSRSAGLIEHQLLSRIGVKPYRCSACKERFYRWSFRSAAPESTDPERSWKGFLSQHDAGFDEVVERLARREAEMELELEHQPVPEGARRWWRRPPAVPAHEEAENVRAS